MESENRLGLMLGARDLVQTMDSRVHQANAEIAKGQAVIDRLYADKQSLEAQIRKLKLALAIEQGHSAGLKAKMRAFFAGLTRANPKDDLLQGTGLFYTDGVQEMKADRLYNDAFDAVMAERHINGKFRPQAK